MEKRCLSGISIAHLFQCAQALRDKYFYGFVKNSEMVYGSETVYLFTSRK